MEWMTYYADTGCDIAPSCLRCPLRRCRYDEPVAMQRYGRETLETARLCADGLTVDEVAARLGISRRTVFRRAAAAATRSQEEPNGRI